jgi:hypothetical protein
MDVLIMNLINMTTGNRRGGKKEKTERGREMGKRREKKKNSEKSLIHKKTEEGKQREK